MSQMLLLEGNGLPGDHSPAAVAPAMEGRAHAPGPVWAGLTAREATLTPNSATPILAQVSSNLQDISIVAYKARILRQQVKRLLVFLTSHSQTRGMV